MKHSSAFFAAAASLVAIASAADSDSNSKCTTVGYASPTTVDLATAQGPTWWNATGDLTDGYNKAGGSCYPLKDDKHSSAYKFTCTISAVGGIKNAATQDYFWCQKEGCTEYCGVEVYEPNHVANHKRGDKVEIVGFFRDAMKGEVQGLTLVDACSVTKVGTGTITPTVISGTEVFGNCTSTAEKYEGMLVKIQNVEFVGCPNANTGMSYSYCKTGIKGTDAKSWDKYYQMWIKSTGCVANNERSCILDVDNHMFMVMTKFTSTPGTQLTSITGVISWFSAPSANNDKSHWEIIPRDEFDVEGGTAISKSDLVTKTLSEVRQTTYKYGSTGDNSNQYYAPSADQMGSEASQAIGGSTIQGTGRPITEAQATAESTTLAALASTYGTVSGTGVWKYGSCPDSQTMYALDAAGRKTHNLCTCYPPWGYNPATGSGTEWVKTTGVVQEVVSANGAFWMADESCVKGSGLFVYRSGGVALQPGHKIEIIARTYVYYGLAQLSDPLEITIQNTGAGVCNPLDITSKVDLFSRPSGTKDWCTAEGSSYVGHYVEVKNVVLKWTMSKQDSTATNKYVNAYPDGPYGEDYGEKVSGALYRNSKSYRDWWQSEGCKDGAGSYINPGCGFEIETVDGKKMLIDQVGLKALGVYNQAGGTGTMKRAIKAGDTFTSLKGYMYSRRGSYGSFAGGYFTLSPTKTGIAGWNTAFTGTSVGKVTTMMELDGMTKAKFTDADFLLAFRLAIAKTVGVSVGQVDVLDVAEKTHAHRRRLSARQLSATSVTFKVEINFFTTQAGSDVATDAQKTAIKQAKTAVSGLTAASVATSTNTELASMGVSTKDLSATSAKVKSVSATTDAKPAGAAAGFGTGGAVAVAVGGLAALAAVGLFVQWYMDPSRKRMAEIAEPADAGTKM